MQRRRYPQKVIHGGTGKGRRDREGKEYLDASASLNPFAPVVPIEVDPADLSPYPDDTYQRLKEVIGDYYHRDPAEVTVGNGSIEIIRTFCRVCTGPRDPVWIRTPTFGEYRFSAELAAAPVTQDPRDASVHFLCNPNNPTGECLSVPSVRQYLEDAVRNDAILFLDEAFIELYDPAQSLSGERDRNLFVLRSLTKAFSVAGIRFGYGFGDPDLISAIEAVRLPWTVNAFAEVYAIAAISRLDELAWSRELIARERDFLSTGIRDLGLPVRPSMVNFILVDLPFPASGFCESLAQKGVLIRDCTSFGLPFAVRIAVGTREENQRVLEAMQQCMP